MIPRKEYILRGIANGLSDPDRNALKRSALMNNDNVPCGAGVAANLVAAGYAKWAGENTWRVQITRLGRAVAWAIEP